MSTIPAGDQKLVEEFDRIMSLSRAIKTLGMLRKSEDIIRNYAEEILMHCDNIEEVRKNG